MTEIDVQIQEELGPIPYPNIREEVKYWEKHYGKTPRSHLHDVRLVAQDLGRPPTREEYDERGVIEDSWTLMKRFETQKWRDIIRYAGLDVKSVPYGKYELSDRDLLDDLLQVTEELGRVPMSREYEEHGEYSMHSFVQRFGSWHEGLYEAMLHLQWRCQQDG